MIVIRGQCSECGSKLDHTLKCQDDLPWVSGKYRCSCGYNEFRYSLPRGAEPIVRQLTGNVQARETRVDQ